ncbi:MAG: 30S ribosomal protein S11 [Candidatus Gracilibacteria bacterium]|jgi:small subunit ribosomal protein S11|nr:30S ribosomal protein S11 [Candidatus Gracilibacteria bacterium]
MVAKQKKSTSKKKKIRRSVLNGRAYITASYNNTIVTITDENGEVISWGSAGASGFKGSRKSTPYAAQVAAENASEKAKNMCGLENVQVFVKGVGPGREQAIRGLHTSKLNLLSIADLTAIPHNGCRAKKPRKV